jgi:hypothetical protein
MLILANGMKFSIQFPHSESMPPLADRGQLLPIHEAVSPSYSYRGCGDDPGKVLIAVHQLGCFALAGVATSELLSCGETATILLPQRRRVAPREREHEACNDAQDVERPND